MKIKKGAILAGLDIRMRPALVAGEKIWKDNDQELVVTAGIDGEHSAGSLHYYGLALDFRIRYFKKPGQKELVYEKLKQVLGSSFDVVLHESHIHVECDF